MVLFYFASSMRKGEREEGHSIAFLLSLPTLLHPEIRCLSLGRFLHSSLLFPKSHAHFIVIAGYLNLPSRTICPSFIKKKQKQNKKPCARFVQVYTKCCSNAVNWIVFFVFNSRASTTGPSFCPLNWFCDCILPFHAVVVDLVHSHFFPIQISKLQWCLYLFRIHASCSKQFMVSWTDTESLRKLLVCSVERILL